MNELAFITAAKHHRNLMKTQQRLDLQHAEIVKARQVAFSNAERKAQLIAKKVERNAQNLIDSRNDIEFEIQDRRFRAQQQQEMDTIAHDVLFKQRRKAIEAEIYLVQDERKTSEARLLRDIEIYRAEHAELNTLAQRSVDIRKALMDWEARIAERRISERNADIKAEIDVQLSIHRISASEQIERDSQNYSLGIVLDVEA